MTIILGVFLLSVFACLVAWAKRVYWAATRPAWTESGFISNIVVLASITLLTLGAGLTIKGTATGELAAFSLMQTAELGALLLATVAVVCLLRGRALPVAVTTTLDPDPTPDPANDPGRTTSAAGGRVQSRKAA